MDEEPLYLLAGWCSGALWGLWGAPAASNPHSCSPGLEPLQSPPVPAAIGSACPGVAAGERSINDNNIQHADPGSDAKARPSPTQDQNLDRSQDRDAWCSLGEQRAGFGEVGGPVCVWLKHSGLLFTSCLEPHHHWLEGGGGGYYAAGWVGGWGMSLDLAEVCSGAWRWCLRRLYGNIQVPVSFKS